MNAATANSKGKQVGGDHYAEGGELQHWDFVTINGLGYLEGCATKYVSRWRKKHGKQDLQKALHYIEKLTELFTTGRIARPALDIIITPEQFATANGLTVKELTVVGLLTGWRGLGDLQNAWEIVDSMIKEG